VVADFQVCLVLTICAAVWVRLSAVSPISGAYQTVRLCVCELDVSAAVN